MVLDRLDPLALTRALPGLRPRGRARSGGPSASLGGYRARRAAQRARTLARERFRAVALDGKTSRGARRPGGTRVHLLGVAEHGGHLLDQVEVGDGHNETSHFTGLLEPLGLAGVVVTSDALHTVRANLDWLVRQKKAHYIAVVKAEPAAAAGPGHGAALAAGAGRQRHPRKAARPDRDPDREGRPVPGLDFPHARQAVKITRWRKDTATGKVSRQTAYAVTSLTSADAIAADLARLTREHWSVEAHHHVRDLSFAEDASTSRTGSRPANLATIRAAIIAALKNAGYLHIPEGRRDHTTPAETLRLHGLN